MRYYTEKPEIYIPVFGDIYSCNHPIYDRCTLYIIGSKGLAVIQQRFDPNTKYTKWTEIDPWLQNQIYLHSGFKGFFDERAGECQNGLYPTVSVRQIMWALRMKPLKRERWETLFDRKIV